MKYVHSGKLGDLVFSIPAFRASGADAYVMVDAAMVGKPRWRPESVVSLLERQGIRSQIWRGGGITHPASDWVNGDKFCRHFERFQIAPGGRFMNLAERQLAAMGLPLEAAARPWLEVSVTYAPKLLIARSARYRPVDARVDWRRLLRWADGDCLFLGLEEERDAFCAEVGEYVPWFPTRDYLEAARLLVGCGVFAVNQTGLQSVAAGLGVAHILEVCEPINWCIFDFCKQWTSTDSFFAEAL